MDFSGLYTKVRHGGGTCQRFSNVKILRLPSALHCTHTMLCTTVSSFTYRISNPPNPPSSSISSLPFLPNLIIPTSPKSKPRALLALTLLLTGPLPSSFRAKTCKPRRCVSFPFWWFSRILICTRCARSTGILGLRSRRRGRGAVLGLRLENGRRGTGRGRTGVSCCGVNCGVNAGRCCGRCCTLAVVTGVSKVGSRLGKLEGTRWRCGGSGMFSLSLERCPEARRFRGRCKSAMCVLKASSSLSGSDIEEFESASPTLEKSAHCQPRGDSRRISPHSWRSFMPDPARKMIRVGV